MSIDSKVANQFRVLPFGLTPMVLTDCVRIALERCDATVYIYVLLYLNSWLYSPNSRSQPRQSWSQMWKLWDWKSIMRRVIQLLQIFCSSLVMTLYLHAKWAFLTIRAVLLSLGTTYWADSISQLMCCLAAGLYLIIHKEIQQISVNLEEIWDFC